MVLLNEAKEKWSIFSIYLYYDRAKNVTTTTRVSSFIWMVRSVVFGVSKASVVARVPSSASADHTWGMHRVNRQAIVLLFCIH